MDKVIFNDITNEIEKKQIETKIVPLQEKNQILLCKEFQIKTSSLKVDYSLAVILMFPERNPEKSSFLQKMFYDHFHILELQLNVLSNFCWEVIYYGILSDREFIPEHVTKFKNFLDTFFNCPRFPDLWNIPTQKRTSLFFNTIDVLKTELKTKNFNKYLSEILTSILMNHLSWITPFIEKSKELEEPEISMETFLTSIYGASYWNYVKKEEALKKFCRFLIKGNNPKVMRALSSLISYFLRFDQFYVKDHLILTNDIFTPLDSQTIPINSNIDSNLKKKDSLSSPSLTISDIKIKMMNGEKLTYSSDEEENSFNSRFGKLKQGDESYFEKKNDFLSQSIFERIPFEKKEPVKKIEIEKKEPVKLKNVNIEFNKYIKNAESKMKQALFADIVPNYTSTFVISSLEKKNIDNNTLSDMIYQDLQMSLFTIIDDKFPDSSSCVIIDSDDLNCELICCTQKDTYSSIIESSKIISDLLNEILSLREMGISDHDVEDYLNDSLKTIFLKSKLFKEVLENNPLKSSYEITKMIKIDTSDIPLLSSIFTALEGKEDLISGLK